MAYLKTQSYEISLEPNKSPQAVVHMKQGDTGFRQLLFKITDIDQIPVVGNTTLIPSYMLSRITCYLEGTKPNGMSFKVNGGELSANSGYYSASFGMEEALTECSGCIEACVRIVATFTWNGGSTTVPRPDKTIEVGTANIILDIQKNPKTTAPEGTKASIIDEISKTKIDAENKISNALINSEAQLDQKVSDAEEHATNANTYANNAKKSAENAEKFASQSQGFALSAQTFANQANETAQEISKKVGDLQYTQSKINSAIEQIKTEKLTGFCEIPAGFEGEIDWDNSNFYRAGAHVFGQLAIKNTGYGVILNYKNENLLPAYKTVFGTILFLDSALPEGNFVSSSQFSLTKDNTVPTSCALRIDDGSAKTLENAVLILDYFCKDDATYFDGDAQLY